MNFNMKLTEEHELKLLEETSALTWEGLDTSEESLSEIIDWLEQIGARTSFPVSFYITKGRLMNEHYQLSGDNAYPDDLNIVTVDAECYSPLKVAVPRFQVGGRWFDDIVDNNRRREQDNER